MPKAPAGKKPGGKKGPDGKGVQRSDGKRLAEEQRKMKIKQEELYFRQLESELSWFSIRGCCKLIRLKCAKRWRRVKRGINQTIHNEIAATGAKKTKTYKTFRRMLRKKSGKGFREVAREWVKMHLTKLLNKSGAKKHKKMTKSKGQGMFEKEMQAGCFGLSSFVIHNDGDVMDFFALDFEKEIGAGGCAHVFKAEERSTHINRAIKRITKRVLPELSMVANEVAIMKSLDHPNIVKLFETFEDDRYFYLVLELCEGGDLLDRLMEVHQFSESQVIVIVRTILMTLNYLHVNFIVHRDVKPENIMFRENRTDVTTSALRIVDFGYACRGSEEEPMMSTKVGSCYYVAPEVLEGSQYDKTCDLWSMGCVAYLLLCGYPPFSGPTDAATLTQVKSGKFIFPHEHWKIISKNAKHLIKHLLIVDPKKRLSMRRALEHPWIRAKGLPKMEHMKEETVDRLITFHKHHPLRRAAMLAIAYQMEAHDVHSLRELFHGLDVNGDGLVQRTEFMKGIQSCGIDETFVQEMIRSVDADGSGIIDYSEFIAATLDRSHYIKNHGVCLRAFRAFDQDDSGMLSKGEVAEILDMKDADQVGEVERFFAEIDTNQDGYMDYGEFHAMLQLEIDPNRDALGKAFGEIEGIGHDDDEDDMGLDPEDEDISAEEYFRRKSLKKSVRTSQASRKSGRASQMSMPPEPDAIENESVHSSPPKSDFGEGEEEEEEGAADASDLRLAAEEGEEENWYEEGEEEWPEEEEDDQGGGDPDEEEVKIPVDDDGQDYEDEEGDGEVLEYAEEGEEEEGEEEPPE
mmetsp:Transcript_130820/g.230481  ORF Transcript_130820/g.230481 Transcript_130820/m.230481 type:complete len:800 (-) Transcript_130820:102-2501(-)